MRFGALLLEMSEIMSFACLKFRHLYSPIVTRISCGRIVSHAATALKNASKAAMLRTCLNAAMKAPFRSTV